MIRFKLFVLLAVPLIPFCCLAQQSPVRDARGVSLLQRSMAALSGALPLKDITLSGSATRIAGSDDETGTATLRAASASESRIDLVLPSGSGSEIRGNADGVPAGNWSGPDGALHPIASHNLWTDTAWFYPGFLAQEALSNAAYWISYVGHETRNGIAVEHVVVWQQPSGQEAVDSIIQQLSRTEIYLDSLSLLPAAIAFDTHPDGDQGLNIPIEIRFSNYHGVPGAQVPFHIQRYLQNDLVLDLPVSEAQVNSGVATTVFNVQ